MKETKYYGIYEQWEKKKKLLFTKSIDGKTFFDEKVFDGYREIDPRRSKLGAAVVKKISSLGIKKEDRVLYLGASHGYTASFVSDIVGSKGVVFCVDFAPRVVRELVFLCEKRENMVPVMADANNPASYQKRITDVNFIFCDVAQRNQAEIFLKNVEMFLVPNGYCIISVKARSVDTARKPKEIYSEIKKKLSKPLRIIDFVELDPLEKDHCVFLCRKK